MAIYRIVQKSETTMFEGSHLLTSSKRLK